MVAYDRSPRLAISISAFAQSMACETTHALLDQSLSTHEAYGGTPHRPDKIGRGCRGAPTNMANGWP